MFFSSFEQYSHSTNEKSVISRISTPYVDYLLDYASTFFFKFASAPLHVQQHLEHRDFTPGPGLSIISRISLLLHSIGLYQFLQTEDSEEVISF